MLYCVSSGLIIACEYIIYYALVFKIVIVGDKLPYLDRNQLYYIYATQEPSATIYTSNLYSICACCIGTYNVLQGQPCLYALEQAPLFSFLLFKQKTHNMYFTTLPILTLNFFAGLSSVFTIIVRC